MEVPLVVLNFTIIQFREIITIQNQKLDNFCTYLFTFFFSVLQIKVTGDPDIYIYIFLSFTNKSGPDNLFESTKSWCWVRSTDSCFYSLTGPLWLTLQ